MRLLVVLGLLAVSCAGTPSLPKLPRATAEQIRSGTLSRVDVDRLARAPQKSLRQALSISVRDDVSGRGFEGRGIVAVRPRSALRMILLGPGGSTAMDVWIREGKFRVAIPALDRVVRGDASTPRSTMRGLPVDLLERWLVDPFGGRLVMARRARVVEGAVIDDPAGLVSWSLRGATLEVRERVGTRGRGWWAEHGKLVAFVSGEESAVTGDDGALFPSTVDYVSLDPPMTVRVRSEGVVEAATLPDATFEDPDAG